ncbi:ABC transporter ATP-binding protein, partial [Rhizobium ruizarguesonis]
CLEVLKSLGKIIIIAEHRLYYLKEIMDRLLVIENRKILSYSKDRISEEILEKHRLRTLKDIEKEELISKSYEVKNLFDHSFDEEKS